MQNYAFLKSGFIIVRKDFNESFPGSREMSQMFSKSLEFCTRFAFFQSDFPKFGRNGWGKKRRKKKYPQIDPPLPPGSTGARSTAQATTVEDRANIAKFVYLTLTSDPR